MIKLALETDEKQMQQQWVEQRGCVCLLAGYLKAVSGSVCVPQWGHLLFSCKLCSLFPPGSQFKIIIFN